MKEKNIDAQTPGGGQALEMEAGAAGGGGGGRGAIEWQRTKSVHKLGMTPHYTWQQYTPPTTTCTTRDPCNVIHTSGSIFSV